MVSALHRRAFLKCIALGAVGVGTCTTNVFGRTALQPGIAWQKRITDAKKLFGSTRDPDGTFVFAGTTGVSPYFVAVDETGTVQWSWMHDKVGVVRSIHSTNDGGYLLGGWTKDYSPTVYKLDSDRELEWSKDVSKRGTVSSVSVAQFNSELFAVMWNEGTTHIKEAHLAAVDSTGAVRWRRSFEHSSQDIWGASALLSADGAVVLVGKLPVDGNEKQIVKVTENDSVEWAVSDDSAPARAVRTDDGGFVLGIPRYVEGDRTTKLTKLDARRNEEWTKTYENDIQHYETRDLVQTADGGYALLGVGYKMNAFDNRVTALLKTASNGEIEWTTTYEHGRNDYSTTHRRLGASTLLPAGRSKLMVAGAAALDERPNGWIALADESAEGVATFTPTPTTTSHRESTSETEQTTSIGQSTTEAEGQTATSVPGFDALAGVGSILAGSLVARWRLQREE